MINAMKTLFLASMLSMSLSGWTTDYSQVISHLIQKPLVLTFVILCSCTQGALANDAPLSDEWTYDNTNLQTGFGAFGVLALSINYLSGLYFYRKSQNDQVQVLNQHIKELVQQIGDMKEKDRLPYAAQKLKNYMNRHKQKNQKIKGE
jgi:hypothetical protein